MEGEKYVYSTLNEGTNTNNGENVPTAEIEIELKEQKEKLSISTTPANWPNYQQSETVIQVALPSSIPQDQTIDATAFSPDGLYLVTYSAPVGNLSVWSVADLRRGHEARPIWTSTHSTTDLMPRKYWEKRDSFTPSFSSGWKMSNVDIAISNGGRYVALSAIKLPQDKHDPEPFLMVNPPPDKINKFFTYVVKKARDRPIFRRNLQNLKGSINFSSDDENFIVCSAEFDYMGDLDPSQGNYIYVYSTHHWRVKHRLVVDNFAKTLRIVPHPWIQVKIIRTCVLADFFVFVEQWDTASLWSIRTGQLITRLKCLQHDSFLDADASPTLFALSHNKQMIATYTSKGVLTIFLCEGGLVFASSLHNKDIDHAQEASSLKREITWIKHDQYVLTVNATNSNHHRVQLWDIYTCQPIYLSDNLGNSTVFQPTGTGSYVSYEGTIPRVRRIVTPYLNTKTGIAAQGKVEPGGTIEAPLKKDTDTIGQHHYLEQGFTKVHSYDGKNVLYESGPGIPETQNVLRSDHPIVELHIEPWLIFEPIKSAFCLDDQTKRVLFIGHYTVQIWIFQHPEKPRLQFIWCKPMKETQTHTPRTVYATIENARLCKDLENQFILELGCEIEERDRRSFSRFSIQHTDDLNLREKVQEQKARSRPRTMNAFGRDDNQYKFEITIPREEDRATFEIVSSAATSLGFLAFAERRYWIQISSTNTYKHFSNLLEQCENIIDWAINFNAHVFNQIVDGKSALEILIKADCTYADQKVKEFLRTDKHIPRFHDQERTKSAFSRAIHLGKTEVVHALLKYYCKHAQENPISWMITVVPAFNSLREMYPDFALEMMKKISYLLAKDEILRSDYPEHYAYSKIEELERRAEETCWQKFTTWLYKSEKDFDRQLEEAGELLRIPHKTHPARECVVPLPDFTVYKSPQISVGDSRFPLGRRILNFVKWHRPRSPYTREILSGRYDIFGEPAMEAVINFKWRKYARVQFFLMLMSYFVYFTLFMIGVSVQDTGIQKIMMILTLALGSLYLFNELMQVLGEGLNYWKSVNNWIELANTVLPMIYAQRKLAGWTDDSSSLLAASMFFMYVNMILQFRVFRFIGIPIFIIFSIFQKVFWFIVIIGIMVFGFAHILVLLIRNKAISDAPDFDHYGTALRAVYFFLVTTFDSLGSARDDPTVSFLLITFTFTTSIILLNILIALMSDVIDITKTDGRRAWLKQKADVIAQIEMYRMTPSQRRRRDFFPSLIYYFASPDKIKAYKKANPEIYDHQEMHHHDHGEMHQDDKSFKEADHKASRNEDGYRLSTQLFADRHDRSSMQFEPTD